MEAVSGLLSAVVSNVQTTSDNGQARSWFARLIDPAGLIVEPVSIQEGVKQADDEESQWDRELRTISSQNLSRSSSARSDCSENA
mmetsp:Transcript_15439/g.33264  ORF Transcript_15439/g.33264 Transcript_15439/m.33264 type:complete len:85 (-) Transcript_15439:1619-1873(-)